MLNSIIKFLLFPNFNEKYYGRKDLVKANLRKKSDERDHKSPKHTPRTKSWQYPPPDKISQDKYLHSLKTKI